VLSNAVAFTDCDQIVGDSEVGMVRLKVAGHGRIIELPCCPDKQSSTFFSSIGNEN